MEIFSNWQWAPKLGFEGHVERVKMGVLKRTLGAGWTRIDFHTREKKTILNVIAANKRLLYLNCGYILW